MRIELSSIFVDDQDKALEFYTKTLGFVLKKDNPIGEFRWLTVVSPEDKDGTELVLEPNDNPAAKTYQQALFEQNIPINAFVVDDVRAEYHRLSDLGVQISMEPTEMGDEIVIVLDDTCGNWVMAYQSLA